MHLQIVVAYVKKRTTKRRRKVAAVKIGILQRSIEKEKSSCSKIQNFAKKYREGEK
jgi:hypothetical protein